MQRVYAPVDDSVLEQIDKDAKEKKHQPGSMG